MEQWNKITQYTATANDDDLLRTEKSMQGRFTHFCSLELNFSKPYLATLALHLTVCLLLTNHGSTSGFRAAPTWPLSCSKGFTMCWFDIPCRGILHMNILRNLFHYLIQHFLVSPVVKATDWSLLVHVLVGLSWVVESKVLVNGWRRLISIPATSSGSTITVASAVAGPPAWWSHANYGTDYQSIPKHGSGGNQCCQWWQQ